MAQRGVQNDDVWKAQLGPCTQCRPADRGIVIEGGDLIGGAQHGGGLLEDSEPPETQDAAQEPEDQPGEERDAEPTPAEPSEEPLMSREEVLRLLDQLAEIEEEGREVLRALAQRRRAPVEQDW